MYLKSIEMHGFKSFAGRIVLTFNEGITGIVGPNGSGKSNVSDAVRWVLGEQSAKSLRGANMQDVIFSGTENKKALSFAYVCLTLDNSDHALPLDFDEVSISRRIYRSGESEYQINKANCRLKDVQELFYDTGIGKEGYSIIGQGQIERILSSKPEDRRELFDEAVGIVKYKKRKEASLKRLQEEEDNLARIEDVLAELTDRIEPLKNQAEKAREFLGLKERQKDLDINLFLLGVLKDEEEEKSITEKLSLVSDSLKDFNEKNENIAIEFNRFNEELRELEANIEELRAKERAFADEKGELGLETKVLEEKINSGNTLKINLSERNEAITKEENDYRSQLDEIIEKHKKDEKNLLDVEKRLEKAREYSNNLTNTIKNLTKETEELNKELLNLKDERTEIISERQKYETKIEQLNIQKATLNQRQLEEGTKQESLKAEFEESKKIFEQKSDYHEEILKREAELKEKVYEFEKKVSEQRTSIEEDKRNLASLRVKRETIKNIAERYEGFGGGVRHIMERIDEFDGVVDVVANLFSSDKKYETAIETALGGALQNIVTKDERSARDCVEFLKKNRHGRVTFLPISSVSPKEEFRFKDALYEKGAIDLASKLVECDYEYRDICEFLLGRILVCENLDLALNIAKKYDYRLQIVTLEGEQLRPGGSITGGNFKNNSNLLGRSRELEELLENIKAIEDTIEDKENKLDEYITAKDLANEDLINNTALKEESAIELNTAAINLKTNENRITQAFNEKEELMRERQEIEDDVIKNTAKMQEMILLLDSSKSRQSEIETKLSELAGQIDENTYMEDTALRNLSEIQIEEANAKSESGFSNENLSRIEGELEKIKAEKEDISKKSHSIEKEEAENIKRIEEIKKEIIKSDTGFEELVKEIEKLQKEREEKQKKNSYFLEEKDRISKELSNLEAEKVRFDLRLEKLVADKKRSADHIWEEYELTYHNALECRNEELNDFGKMHKELSDINSRLRTMGPVNTAAIEEYANVSERYEFLTGQSNDLKEGRERILNIIDDLNTEMQARFEEGFAEISKEFDKVFKELFGGGVGKLELSDEKDVLESGIRIIAQPPGKKLSNMMQLSGGEKSLTAIAILFAILNLKPSPFCLLDEIEAALDEPNVDRFAKYLNKLTENTQFIIITHRRGTMNAADRLYGITMQEKGISALVSVSLIEDELE